MSTNRPVSRRGLRVPAGLRAAMLLVALLLMRGLPSVAGGGQDSLLDTYMTRLAELRLRWQQATECVVRGETGRAIELLDRPPAEVLGNGWAESQRILSDELRSMILVDAARLGTRRFAKWCMGMQAPKLAARA